MQTKKYQVLMWMAAGLLTISAIMEMTEGEYIKMAQTCCIALVFLLSPFTNEPTKSQSRKTAVSILMILAMLLWAGLFAYGLIGRKGG